MFRRDNISTWMASVVMAALFVFLSCASNQTSSDEFGEGGDEDLQASSETLSEEASGEKKDLSELEATLDENKDTEKQLEEGKTDELATENLAEKTTETTLAEATPVESTPPVENTMAMNEPVPTTEPTVENQPTIEPPAIEEKKPRKKRSGGGSSNRIGKIPAIPGRAIQKNGLLLNRFYFVRQGDKGPAVSQLLFGGDRLADLKKGNGKLSWAPGSLIYYNAPHDPTDSSMKSFFQERNVPFEEYTVAAGEKIGTIAAAKLGSTKSWTEIAVLNGLESGTKLEAEKKLAIYPKDLSQYGVDKAGGQQVAKEEVPVVEAKTEAAPPPKVETEPAPPAPVAPKKVDNGGGFDFGKFVEQNLFAVAVGGVLLLLLATLSVLQRKRKAKKDEFGEDFSSTPKAKRK